jgi:hypothetical protein
MSYYDEEALNQQTRRGYAPPLGRRAGSIPLALINGPTDWESLREKGYAATIILQHHGQPAKGWALVHAQQVTNLVKNQTIKACPYTVLGWHIFPLKFTPKP